MLDKKIIWTLMPIVLIIGIGALIVYNFAFKDSIKRYQEVPPTDYIGRIEVDRLKTKNEDSISEALWIRNGNSSKDSLWIVHYGFYEKEKIELLAEKCLELNIELLIFDKLNIDDMEKQKKEFITIYNYMMKKSYKEVSFLGSDFSGLLGLCCEEVSNIYLNDISLRNFNEFSLQNVTILNEKSKECISSVNKWPSNIVILKNYLEKFSDIDDFKEFNKIAKYYNKDIKQKNIDGIFSINWLKTILE